MPTQAIFAEQTVSITELRKNPSEFFKEEPVAVLSNNKTAGYMLSAELYEQMLQLLNQQSTVVKSRFRPTRTRLDEIAKNCSEALLNATSNENL